MAALTNPIPAGLRLSNDPNDALTTWSTSQRTVIGLAADFADSGEWMDTSAASAAHWIAGGKHQHNLLGSWRSEVH